MKPISNKFLAVSANLQRLKKEMVDVFKQKRALGLVNCGRDPVSFSDEPPMLLLVLVNHDPDSSKLRAQIEPLPPSPHAEVYLATACFMGYGLFDQGIFPIEEALTRFKACI